MLGSPKLSVRLGGIYALERLASERPSQYHLQIMQLLCAFIRDHASLGYPVEMIQEDFQAVLSAVANRGSEQLEIERRVDSGPELEGARLKGARLFGGDLTQANLVGADLRKSWVSGVNISDSYLQGINLEECDIRRANFRGADLTEGHLGGATLLMVNLSGSDLSRADLTKVRITDSDLSDADLTGTNLSGAMFSRVTGLTQNELGRASSDSRNPPEIWGSVDPETGDRLAWRND